MYTTVYNQIGKEYNSTRNSDPRIVKSLLKWISEKKPTIIADIGAGTGNYSYEIADSGINVCAVEPSELMHSQKKYHKNLYWLYGVAEELPIVDESVESVVSTLASHHFSDLKKSIKEIVRIVKKSGTIILFSADPRLVDEDCWIKNYFHPLFKKACKTLPSIDTMTKYFSLYHVNNIKIDEFKLPPDLTDNFFYAGWKNPEKYLDAQYRNGISVFANSDAQQVQGLISRLSDDLDSGAWDNKYGHVRDYTSYNGGYYFLIADK